VVLRIHNRLSRDRGIPSDASDFHAAAWLTTRAYVVHAIDSLREPDSQAAPEEPDIEDTSLN
jgi:hypothetical protein